MKKYFILFAAATIVLAAFSATGCKKDDGPDPVDPTVLPVPPMADYAVKVDVTTLETPYISFEATEGGRYIVGKADGTYATGSYTFNDGVYALQNFGKVVVSKTKADNTVLYLTFIPDGEGEIKVEGTPATQSTDDYTKELCRLWEIKKTRISLTDAVNVAAEFNGCNLNEIQEFITQYVDLKKKVPAGMNVTGVTFTSMSTYMIEYTAHPADIGEWNWDSVSHSSLKYKWNKEDMGYEWENGSATIEYVEGHLLFSGSVDLKNDDKNYHVTVYMTMAPKQ